MAVPVDVRFTARYDDEHGWRDIEFDQVSLDQDESDRRSSRPTAAEQFLFELEERNEE